MHVYLKDQKTGEVHGIMCAERDSSTCIILRGDLDWIERLVGMAGAMHVDKVLLVTDNAGAEELTANGWKHSQLCLLEKTPPAKKGKS